MGDWRSRTDFCEVAGHYSVLELFRDRLERHGFEVAPRRQREDGSGAIRAQGHGEFTVIPYRLPEDLERLERVARQLLETTGAWREGPRQGD